MFGARGRSSEDAIDGVWGAGTRWNGRNERGIKEGELKGGRDHVLVVKRHPTRREWGEGEVDGWGTMGGPICATRSGKPGALREEKNWTGVTTEWRGVTGSGRWSPECGRSSTAVCAFVVPGSKVRHSGTQAAIYLYEYATDYGVE